MRQCTARALALALVAVALVHTAAAIPYTLTRPNVLFGTRTTTPKPLLTGFAWQSLLKGANRVVRHNAVEDPQLRKFIWYRNDAQGFGQQELLDNEVHRSLLFDWVTLGDNVESDAPWIVRLKIASKARQPRSMRLDWYASTESGSFSILSQIRTANATKAVGPVVLNGVNDGNHFSFVLLREIERPSNSTDEWQFVLEPLHQHFVQFDPYDSLRHHKPQLVSAGVLPGSDAGKRSSSILLRQNIGASGTVFAVYVPHSALPEGLSVLEYAQARVAEFPTVLQAKADAFDERFEAAFRIPRSNELLTKAARTAVSNLLGGISFFHGNLFIRDGANVRRGPASSLYTGVPSRSKFPRGFLWDEGFHQLLVSHWSPATTFQVVSHWLKTMDARGWIGREQVLQPDSMSPHIFQQFGVQDTSIANPPTMLLVVQSLLDRIVQQGQAEQVAADGTITPADDTTDDMQSFVTQAYPLLQRHFEYLYNSQRNSSRPNAFYWRGTTQDHCLASGIDDYPRENATEHVDLLGWMSMSARVLSRVARMVGADDDAHRYDQLVQSLVDTLPRHWNATSNVFCDYNSATDTPVCHVGYVGYLPVFLRALPIDSPLLPAAVQGIRSLLSPYGLRSLHESDPYYFQGEAYWRGNIWINMNYLAVNALTYYGNHGVPGAAQLAQDIRTNVVNNILREYTAKDTFFEHYNPENGAGGGTRPFTGWTTLFVLLAQEQ